MEEGRRSRTKAAKVVPATTKKVYFLHTGVVHGHAAESAELLLRASRPHLGVQASSIASLGSDEACTETQLGGMDASSRYTGSKFKRTRPQLPERINFGSTQSLRFSEADSPGGLRGTAAVPLEGARRSQQIGARGAASTKDIRKMAPSQMQGSRNVLRGAGAAADGPKLHVMSSRIDDNSMMESQRDSVAQPDDLHSAVPIAQLAAAERFLTDSKTRNHDMLSKDYESEFA